MSKLHVIRQIGSILDKFTERRENNISYGKYPAIVVFGDKIRLFNLNGRLTRLGWLMPIGIPYVIKKTMADGSGRNNMINIAYQFGERVYVNLDYFSHLKHEDEKILYSPTVDKVIQLSKGGWNAIEQADYNKFMWQYVLKTNVGNFRKVSNIEFDMAMSIDAEMLTKIGWTVNQVLGRNAFYGIITTGTKQANRSKKNPTYRWYSKYLVVLDITGGNGLEVWSYLEYKGNQHPHINAHGQLCRGSFANDIQSRIDKGLITEFFVLMADFLEHYSNKHPFFHLPLDASVIDSGRLTSTSKFILDKVVLGERS
jgi:hypothetical protein